MAINYKTVDLEEGKKAVVMDEKGFPVIIDDDGKEKTLDAIHLYTKIPQLNNELSQTKNNLAELQKKLEPLQAHEVDLEKLNEFVAEALKNKETVSNFDAKKLIDAGEVEIIKRQAQEHLQEKITSITSTFETQIADVKRELQRKESMVQSLLISERFNTSEFVKEQLAYSPYVANKTFSEHFKVEEMDGGFKVIGYFNGERLYSRIRPGELATFDEALEMIIDKHPEKDSLLIGRKGKGSGTHASDTTIETDQLIAQYKAALGSGDFVTSTRIKNELFSKGIAV